MRPADGPKEKKETVGKQYQKDINDLYGDPKESQESEDETEEEESDEEET